MNTTAPNVFVTTHVTTKEAQGVRSPADWVTVPGGAAGTGTASVETYIDGTLVVDLYDAQTKKMVWRGVATATASDKPSKNMSKMNKALDKMLRKVPDPPDADELTEGSSKSTLHGHMVSIALPAVLLLTQLQISAGVTF